MAVLIDEAVKTATVEEFWRLSQNDQFRGELIAGEVCELVPPGYMHSCVGSNVFGALLEFVKARKLGRVIAECGFVISRDPDTVLAPDVAFISTACLPAAITEKFSEVVPDLAIEVLSPGDTYAEVREKADQYLAGGVKEIWIVDPRRRAMEILRPPDKRITLHGGDRLETPLLPGFSALVNEVFE